VSSNFLISPSSALAPQSTTEARTSQALRTLQSKQGDHTKIEKAAREFESILLGEWLQQAEKSFATVPGSDPDKDADAGHDQFQSIGCEYLATALTKNGGIGLAAMISKHLEAVASQNPQPAEAGDESHHGIQAETAAQEKLTQVTDKEQVSTTRRLVDVGR
jgi:Rod binding domain-containing protein